MVNDLKYQLAFRILENPENTKDNQTQLRQTPRMWLFFGIEIALINVAGETSYTCCIEFSVIHETAKQISLWECTGY